VAINTAAIPKDLLDGCLVMKRGASPARKPCDEAGLSRPMAARLFLDETCHSICKPFAAGA
jgi:hypothetical protein